MTKEYIIEFDEEINEFGLQKVMFDASDTTDRRTDRTVSMKLIDAEGNYRGVNSRLLRKRR